MCIHLKKNLSFREEFTYFLDQYDGNSDLVISMSRMKFEEISNDIFSRIMDVVELCLEDSDLSKSDIDEIILVGGSTRIPKIKEMLTSYFGVEKIKMDLNPDEAAFVLAGHHDMEKYKVIEVTPLSLGVDVNQNRMLFLIPRNSPLPAKASQHTKTAFNYQTLAEFTVYEGERKITTYNNMLGKMTITGLPKKRAGDVAFSVNFDLDEDGILSVSATETSTGNSNKLVVTMGHFRLSDRKIKSSLEDAKKHKT
ncbi:78 kDa glucose-regulated protein homolog [Anoplophora glabripennis]|uniref:78 kDa glucose-regulated protein homolog n=1 Tax=Anoplophora glabripennis TaxID=217634 RepID=UPI000C7822B7|nr:78 kDa glucose-regulated protein homolog [Anoplophora glabripennis]